jgi:hypothetical protein
MLAGPGYKLRHGLGCTIAEADLCAATPGTTLSQVSFVGVGPRAGDQLRPAQTSLRTSSIVKPRKVSPTAFPRLAMMSAIFATVSSSGASVIAIWSY